MFDSTKQCFKKKSTYKKRDKKKRTILRKKTLKHIFQGGLIKNIPNYSLSNKSFFFDENLFISYCLRSSVNLMNMKNFRKHMQISDADFKNAIQFLHTVSFEKIREMIHVKTKEYETRNNSISKLISSKKINANTNANIDTNTYTNNIIYQKGSNNFRNQETMENILNLIENMVRVPKLQFIFIHVMYFLCANTLPHAIAINVYIFLTTLFTLDTIEHGAFIIWILQIFYLCNEYHDVCQAIELFFDIVVKIIEIL